MILGICTDHVFITLNLFTIVPEALMLVEMNELRADLTNIPTSGWLSTQDGPAQGKLLLSKVSFPTRSTILTTCQLSNC